jgi:hypothetical protein
MTLRITASCLALVLFAPTASAWAQTPSPIERDHRATPVVRDHRATPIVRDHRTTPFVRDHRSNVRDHRAGTPGGGVVVTKTPGAERRPACVNNVCRDVTR